ncbi:hypothetical protein COLO4_25949 [Corchorus olitorius]|uniref:Uncharacterized protein n=1 Tax=Corchorus olitorius TaxID=93759 RepID=A0A1R3HZH6_9ROSI|nr:hypothetical protein COLO4_25949 [Corchorus olitorius]
MTEMTPGAGTLRVMFPDPPKRVRRPTYRLDDDYIAKYNKAVSIMKSLPFDDPRNFVRQATCTVNFAQEPTNNKTPMTIEAREL